MNAYWYSIQWGFKPGLNKVKASGGYHRFSEEIYRAELDKIWVQIRQGEFDTIGWRNKLWIIFPCGRQQPVNEKNGQH
ncbi:hypothetical protein D5F11_001375 [Siminovitchia terrae]|uniref:Uncharacterized protein n=1 Tax=Siminovitchia terrae TaxID=1914933 RepID=A0A429XDL9_SIMTE|nr:hypothetical protein [Siminovitchia terrae]RST61555.1 hypothetical protein D5F11_001375 [Siminovitchia terrae]